MSDYEIEKYSREYRMFLRLKNAGHKSDEIEDGLTQIGTMMTEAGYIYNVDLARFVKSQESSI